MPHDNPWVLRKGRPHCTKVTEEEEEEGANRSQVWEGLGGGNRLTLMPPLVFGNPGTDGGQLELAEDKRPKCGNLGRWPPRASQFS